MPGCCLLTPSNLWIFRPQTITVFLFSKKTFANDKPIPDAPPVMRTVFPVIFINSSLLHMFHR